MLASVCNSPALQLLASTQWLCVAGWRSPARWQLHSPAARALERSAIEPWIFGPPCACYIAITGHRGHYCEQRHGPSELQSSHSSVHLPIRSVQLTIHMRLQGLCRLHTTTQRLGRQLQPSKPGLMAAGASSHEAAFTEQQQGFMRAALAQVSSPLQISNSYNSWHVFDCLLCAGRGGPAEAGGACGVGLGPDLLCNRALHTPEHRAHCAGVFS